MSHHHARCSQFLYHLLQLAVERIVEQAEGRQTVHTVLDGTVYQLLHLHSGDRDGLLHQHVVTALHGFQSIFVMHVVGIGHIHIVGFCLLEHAVIIGEDKPVGGIFHAQVDGMFHALLACIDACHLYLSLKLLAQHLEHFAHYLACSGYAYFHPFRC